MEIAGNGKPPNFRFREPLKDHEIEIEGEEIRFLSHGREEEVLLNPSTDCLCFFIFLAWEKLTPRELASYVHFYSLPGEVREILWKRATERRAHGDKGVSRGKA